MKDMLNKYSCLSCSRRPWCSFWGLRADVSPLMLSNGHFPDRNAGLDISLHDDMHSTDATEWILTGDSNVA